MSGRSLSEEWEDAEKEAYHPDNILCRCEKCINAEVIEDCRKDLLRRKWDLIHELNNRKDQMARNHFNCLDIAIELVEDLL